MMVVGAIAEPKPTRPDVEVAALRPGAGLKFNPDRPPALVRNPATGLANAPEAKRLERRLRRRRDQLAVFVLLGHARARATS